jgi:hypothetical protein
MMKKGLLILAGAAMLLTPLGASAAIRVGVALGGPVWYGLGPYWGPYWYPYAYTYPNTGEVKVETKVKDAEIFINGAYAGNTHDSKTVHLRPGTYDIEIREGGQSRYAERVYVAAGQTVKLHPEL